MVHVDAEVLAKHLSLFRHERGGGVVLPELHDRVLNRTPQGRWGEPEDLAGAAVFLASKASDFVTGVSLTVDGGYSIQAP